MKRRDRLVVAQSCVVLVALLCTGCVSREDITHRYQLADPDEYGSLAVLMKDSTVHRLSSYRLLDSIIVGTGYAEKLGAESKFSGSIPVDSILYIQGRHVNYTTSVLAVGFSIFLGVTAFSNDSKMLGDPLTLQVDVRTYYKPRPGTGTGGSGGPYCPHVYSFNGAEYRLESGAFAGAIVKTAERAAYDHLRFLRPVDGLLKIRLSNELPETEYVNELRLLAVDVPPGVEPVVDPEGVFHTVVSPVQPVCARDLEGNDVLSRVVARDSVFWRSDIHSKDLTDDRQLRDGIILEFPKPAGIRKLKLLVQGANTGLLEFAFQALLTMKGDNLLRWYRALEEDPKEGEALAALMVREGMLHISVWRNDQWEEQCILPDLGPEVLRNQMAVLDVRGISSDVLKVRLESATDLWRIDAVGIAPTRDTVILIREQAPCLALDEKGKELTAILAAADDRYYVNVLGQHTDVTYQDVPQLPGMDRYYFVKASGYYHDWASARGPEQVETFRRVMQEPLFLSRRFMPLWKQFVAAQARKE